METRATVTAIPTPYICEARLISPTGASSVNVLRSYASVRADLVEPVPSGTQVLLLSKMETSTHDWYQVATLEGEMLGWIEVHSRNLELLSPCNN